MPEGRVPRPLIGNAGRRRRRLELCETRTGSGAGCHAGSQDVVRVPVEILAGSVVAHRGTWIGVPGGDLDVPEVHASIQTGSERFTNHVE